MSMLGYVLFVLVVLKSRLLMTLGNVASLRKRKFLGTVKDSPVCAPFYTINQVDVQINDILQGVLTGKALYTAATQSQVQVTRE